VVWISSEVSRLEKFKVKLETGTSTVANLHPSVQVTTSI